MDFAYSIIVKSSDNIWIEIEGSDIPICGFTSVVEAATYASSEGFALDVEFMHVELDSVAQSIHEDKWEVRQIRVDVGIPGRLTFCQINRLNKELA